MELETTGVEVQEVAAPEIVSVETQEVAEPEPNSVAVEETVPEVATPARDKERDSWFAEQRRKLDAERKEIEQSFQAKLEAERQRIAELESKTKVYEVNDRNAKLREFAEKNGLDADELIAEAERQEALDKAQADKEAELQNEKSEKQRIAEEKAKLEADLKFLKMTLEDRDELLSIDPTINLNELGDDFYQLRMNGFSPTKAYKMSQALKEPVEVAEAPGKLNSVQAESEYYTEAEWDAMTPEQQDKLMETNWEKVKRSHDKWLGK